MAPSKLSPSILSIDTPRGVFGARALGDPGAPLVICLHDVFDDASTFDDLLDRLATRGFRAVAPYLRGYAPSPRRGPWGAEAIADDLIAIADALAPVIAPSVVGHGLGALAVYHALAREPGRFARAVTLAMPHPDALIANVPRSARQLARLAPLALLRARRIAAWWTRRHGFAPLLALRKRWSPGLELPADQRARIERTFADSWPCPLAHLRARDLLRDASPIATPMLYLHGARDRCLAPEMAVGQERAYVGMIESRVVGDAGHDLHLERPAVVAAEILRWLADELPRETREADVIELSPPRLA